MFPGCEVASSHVWRGILYEISGQHKDLDGFAKTRVPRNRAQPSDGNYGVYGIDGEMLFTTNGLQLCKVTVSIRRQTHPLPQFAFIFSHFLSLKLISRMFFFFHF